MMTMKMTLMIKKFRTKKKKTVEAADDDES